MATPILTDGSTSFGGGVDSIKATTVQGMQSPDSLARNQLAWLVNGTVRDGGISPRWGWQPIYQISDGNSLYQRGYMYQPDVGDPYLMLQIGGRIYQVNPQAAGPTDLSATFGLTNSPLIDRAYFCQAENYLVIQAGDYVTLPLFWDGATLWRSVGIQGIDHIPGSAPLGQLPYNELPAAGPMCYYMGRLWYAQDRILSAGDLVGGLAGTIAPHYRDSVIHVTENPLCVGGDGFTVPSNAGHIRAIQYMANLDTTTGEGRLYIFTHREVYSLQVPVTRSDWISTGSANGPLMTVAQIVNGAVGDGSVVPVNGDLYFQSFEPGIRSLVAAIRYFQQPGNIQISANVNRILQFNDRSLLQYSSGIEFDNRLLMTSLPFSTPVGTAHHALVPLDFVPASSFNQAYAPVWEGHWEGVDILQLFQGNFGGRQRSFAVVLSRRDQTIWLWELTVNNAWENGDNRVEWQIEFPAFTWDHLDQMKKLVGGELWIDRLFGTLEIKLDYRVDGETCWIPWHQWKECSARNSDEDALITHLTQTSPYPIPYGQGYRQTMDLPAPPSVCSQMSRPSNIGYQFQPRLTMKGYCRVRGIFLHATAYEKRLYHNVACS